MRTMFTHEQFENLRADAAELLGILSEMVDFQELSDRGPKAVQATKLAKRIRFVLAEPEFVCRAPGGIHDSLMTEDCMAPFSLRESVQ
jgi:hypothetical protein